MKNIFINYYFSFRTPPLPMIMRKARVSVVILNEVKNLLYPAENLIDNPSVFLAKRHLPLRRGGLKIYYTVITS